MAVLDCGCGPGTITLDLARAADGGRVVGVDIELTQTRQAQAEAGDLGLGFVEANAYTLSFPDQTFDAVFAHALIEHLVEPDRVLREMRRVLRRGGVVGLRSPDRGGFIVYPLDEGTLRALDAYATLQCLNGGYLYAGRKLGAYLRCAGFVVTDQTASHEVYTEPELIAEYLAETLETQGPSEQGRIAAANLRLWSCDRDAFFAQSWVEAVGTC